MQTIDPKNKRIGDTEMTVMMAAVMALNALAIDAMLPAFPKMASGLQLSDINKIQYVISAYILGVGAGSLIHGPLSDRYGRRPILLAGIAGYILFALACSFSNNFEFLLAMRMAQGLCAAALNVLVTSIIRDQYSGDIMARRMSSISMVFMAVPIMAPLVGYGVLFFAGWRVIFDLIAVMGIVVFSWVMFRLPETLDPINKTLIEIKPLTRAWIKVANDRSANCYMLASGVCMGALFGYINTSQQIFDKSFGVPDFFPYGFAIIAIGLACANFVNARIVERFGARRVSQTALFVFIIMGALQWVSAVFVPKSLPIFLALITVNMAMIGFIGSNFASIAMQPFGKIAGSASSFQNFSRTILSAIVGAFIGQQFESSPAPVALGFAICGLTALALILIGEKGRLFTRPGTTKHIAHMER